MIKRTLYSFGIVFISAILALGPAGCGGSGGGGSSDGGDEGAVSFWAVNFMGSATPPYDMYSLKANLVGEGEHCYIYLERGRIVSNNDINNIIDQFDNKIYPNLTAAYGNDLRPVIDGDSDKTYILLLDIKDGWNGISITAYTAGYFYSMDQNTSWGYSNKKNILYMDIYPGMMGLNGFNNLRHAIAHEFQHLIHWSKTKSSGSNNIWLNEAMSEVAPYYAFGETNPDRVTSFKSGTNHSCSLTDWGSSIASYAITYMWAQYMADRFDRPQDNVFVFRDILNVSNRGQGKNSVDEYFSQKHAGINFASVFRDWSLAIFFGDGRSGTPVSTPNDNWKYKTINTWFDGSGNLFNTGNLNNATTALRPLSHWSIGYYWWNDVLQSPLEWNNSGVSNLNASFHDLATLELDMAPDKTYPYTERAYLILRNTPDDPGFVGRSISPTYDWVLSTQQNIPPTPEEKLRAISESMAAESPMLRRSAAEPTPVCMHDILSWRAEEIQSQLQENQNNQ